MTTETAQQPRGPRADLISGWTNLRNGELDAAQRICSPETRIRFGGNNIAPQGDLVSTPEDLADLIAQFRATRPDPVYRVVDAQCTQSWGYCVWNATMGSLRVGGIDTFTFSPEGITHVCSVTAQRPMSW